MTYERIVIVGGSLAGLRAAQSLRRQGHDGEVIIVDADPDAGYDHPPLSKGYLAGTQGEADIRLDSGDLEATRLRGVTAQRVDTSRGVLTLADNTALPYDGLVIASGARARRPEWAHRDGVHVLRDLADATALRAELSRHPRVLIIGGGFIGCEVAATARSAGCEVTLLDAGRTLLHQAVGVEVGHRVAALHDKHGVRVLTNTSVEQWHGKDRVEAVRLSTGEVVHCDVVVLGLGATPNTDWLHGSGIALDNGVRCDAALRTSAPHVVAAGDVASWPNPAIGGRRQRVEHWTNAASQGTAAAKTLLHGEGAPPFSSVPTFWSDQYDLTINSLGWPELASEPPQLDTDETDAVTAEYHRRGELVGVVTWGPPAKLGAYRRQIRVSVERLDDVAAEAE